MALLRVASYNIHLAVGRDGRSAPGRIAAVLGELGAAVIALQEVESDEAGCAMCGRLAEITGLSVVPGPVLLRASGHYGNALLTALPVRQVRRIDLSVPRREPRGALDVDIVCGQRTLRVVATHLGLEPAERCDQVRHLLEILKDASGPTVLLGDLNEWFLWGRPLRWLRAYFAATPAPATFPARCPLLALDRIWVHPRALLQSVTVHRTPLARIASDHLPVSGLLDLRD